MKNRFIRFMGYTDGIHYGTEHVWSRYVATKIPFEAVRGVALRAFIKEGFDPSTPMFEFYMEESAWVRVLAG